MFINPNCPQNFHTFTTMKTYFKIILFLSITSISATAQLGGVFNIPTNFPTIAAAITSLNTLGVAAPVTINIAAGYTETAVPGGYKLFNVTGASATNQITFRKNGSGANPLIYAYTGTATPTSAVQDGVWWLIGADYITIDGIDIVDPNTSGNAMMEFGFGLFKVSSTNGCLYNTIQNCVISLNRNNGSAGSGPIQGGSCGIELVPATSTLNTNVLSVSSFSGTNSNNKFYGNTIQNCHIGIALIGYSLSIFDQQNDIGGLTSVTGNTIINFGSGSGSASYGVLTLAQNSLTVSNNVLNNNNGSGANPLTDLTAIRIGTASNAVSSINNNTISLIRTTFSSQGLWGIHIESGSSSPANSLNINHNVFPSYTYSSSAPNMYLILNNSNSNIANINNICV